MTYNVFVLGLDDLGHHELTSLPNAEAFTFHGLLTIGQLQDGTIDLPQLLQQAQDQLEAFDGSIDAIIGYWDFPVTVMLPLLCERYGLPARDLTAVVKCEHKYWSRLEQQRVIDEYPGFAMIDIHDPHATLPAGVSYPAWLKPINSFSSEGAHRVANDAELQAAMAEERDAPERLGSAFDFILDKVDLPDEIADIPGGAYMVEESATGQQLTVEGYSWQHRVEIIGIIDSFNYPQAPSFESYQYPSQLPDAVQQRLRDVTRRIIEAVGLNNSTFNVEYFWDADTQSLTLLEINARHSQSHASLFHWVDGLPNHALMLDLALGRQPLMPHRQGDSPRAAKWMLRRFKDGYVQRVPTAAQIDEIQQRYPGVLITIETTEGTYLSDADTEDSYSYSLAEIFTAGDTPEQLREIYEQCRAELDFVITDVKEAT